MLVVSLAISLAFAPTPQAPAAGPFPESEDAPTIESEARRMGVTPLALERALRGTSRRQRASLEDPLYCLEDRLSVPAQPRWVCHTRVQWQNAGFEPILP